MKSIHEASVAYGREHQGTVNIEDFEAGANYVLDAITECLPKTHSFNPNEVIDIIASRIKELKK
jgi:hypothetical protein